MITAIVRLLPMNSDSTSKDYRTLFDLKASHSLEVSSTYEVKRDGIVFKTRWLEEHDEHKNLIARFRTWTNRSLKPPYRFQLGWERYSLTGELLDREVRYSTRSSMEYVH